MHKFLSVLVLFCLSSSSVGQVVLFRSSECWSTSISETVFCRQNATRAPGIDVFSSPKVDDERFQLAFPERSPRIPGAISYSDQQIRQILIRRSILAFAGSCACPYFSNADGTLCADDSAWSRRDAGAPLCYDVEVNSFMIRDYRLAHP